ncbi:DUF5680 domain-containing protein [Micromonospora sp. NPDC023966]|uniref:DUF5680 domain-containing protein n=1 Tax=Micromonospora sp. NPDC023966 TaxID=3154699 RepID=UPI0033E414BC
MNDSLRDFLLEARAYGWPEHAGPSTHPAFPGFIETRYSRDAWDYSDLWSGTTTDLGMQIIFHGGAPYWGCTYRGGVIDPADASGTGVPVDVVFEFLIDALRQPSCPTLPVRGPETYRSRSGSLRYSFQPHGRLPSFIAFERISLGDRLLYERILTGGRFGDGQGYGQALGSLLTANGAD